MPEAMNFVPLFEKGIMQFVIMSKAKQGSVTKENLRQTFQRTNMRMNSDHLEECLRDLQQTGHIRMDGDKVSLTDDGREDIQKVQHLILEAPQAANLTDNRATSAGTTMPTGGTKTQTTI